MTDWREWPPETVEIHPGWVEPFEQAIKWHLPTMLRWLSMNVDAELMPDGSLRSGMLQAAASTIEWLSRECPIEGCATKPVEIAVSPDDWRAIYDLKGRIE